MGSYYYLLSQLPFLTFGQKPPMTSRQFKDLALPLMEKNDAAVFALIDTYNKKNHAEWQPSGSVFFDNWVEWENCLRLNLAKQRFIKIKRDGVPPAEPPEFPSDAVITAAKAMQENPLDAEALINKARWNTIETLQGTDYFSSNSVFAYMLKLQILERHILFQTESGLSEYKSLYASIGDYK